GDVGVGLGVGSRHTGRAPLHGQEGSSAASLHEGRDDAGGGFGAGVEARSGQEGGGAAGLHHQQEGEGLGAMEDW
ncbi:unnamed protein product, partial [Urochloa humidicola]